MKNKKADAAIVGLVFMALALTAAALVSFIVMEQGQLKRVSEHWAVERFYASQENLEIFMKNLAEKIVLDNPTIQRDAFIEEFKKQFEENAVAAKEIDKEELLWGARASVKIADFSELKIENKVLYFKIKNFRTFKTESKDEPLHIVLVRDVYFEIGF